jgi:acyl transferase domain-containing protein/NADPH:quinone reductase-like Zn-dependent oxidoreductase/NADP-dependent 3-hydroxy acid dehydrogenase YdfG/acyl carrier protein
MKFRSDRARIAVVGAAFRMPGVGGDGFWEALLTGKDLISSVESSRWAQDSYVHPRKSEPGASYTFAAGSIGDVSGFDAAFFGISPREAEQMDPQQRLLLEMSWEAFENAAIRPSSMRGNRCGVYVGLSSVDYASRRADDMGSIDATTMTGTTGSIAANRISYVFDLRGPSMTVDTACSSSLVALHQACQSIRHGESDTAIVGGISLHLHPYAFIGFSKASMLSRHGRCSVFDERADGYVRSEGGAVVLLKPLAQAIADGNQILGVIAETGVNNDGRKTGLTVPSHAAQAALLREVYERAGIAPGEIDYFEAHGTGTAIGDPIEARAIGEAIGQLRSRERPLPIGSVKSQVGHLEAASGMAGLIKVLHVLRHRCVPPNIHLEKPNPNIDFADWNLAPVTTPLALNAAGRVVIGVSAFGFGGTNAHAVLTSFEAAITRPRPRATTRAPLMLSARSPGALQEGARRMARFLSERTDVSDYDVAYSAMFARDIHAHRLSADGEDRASVVQALDHFADSGAAPGIVTGRHRRDASAPVFVFSGNGSQWVGMGLRLLDEEPVFREALEEIDLLLASHADRSIVADLRAAPVVGGFERTEVAQPALFAIQVGVTRLLERQGVHPVAVCGHSVGEVAAAWASGVLTLEAAVRVIHERSAHQALTRGTGCMAAVELEESEITSLLASLGLREDIVVAAINSPSGVTVAGNEGAMSRLGAALARRHIVFKRLALEYAFHSAAMDPIREGLTRSLTHLSPESSRIPMYSTVTGTLVEGTGLDADYWWRNVREPVRFDAAIRAMLIAGINTFVEIGPRPVLSSYLNDIAKAVGVSCFAIPSLTTNEPGGQRIRSVSQQLELSGALHDPARLFPVAGQLVELPQYAWQRERYWHPSTAESLGLLARRVVHPLLGYALAGDSLHWENHLDTTKLPAYADHAVGGSVVFPAAGFVEMALAAAASRRPGTALAIEDMEILSPLLLEPEHSKVVRLRIHPEDVTFTIVSRDHGREDNWRTHAVGRFVDDFVPAHTEPLQQPSGTPDVTAEAHYALASSHGLQYGPAFQSVASAWICDGGLVGTLRLPDCVAEQSQTALLHPVYLDGAFQLLLDLAWHEHGGQMSHSGGRLTFLPVRIDRLELARPPVRVAAAQVVPGVSRHRSRRALHADFTLYDESGAAVTVARGVRFRATNLQRGTADASSWIATRAVAMPRRDRASATPSPVEAGRLCAQRLHTPARTASRLRFAREMEPLLDVLCGSFAERALRKIAQGVTIDPAELLAAGHVCADGVPLLRHLLQVLAEDGVVQSAGGQWRWSTPSTEMHFPEPEDIWSSLIGDYPEYGAILARTGAAGVHLAERLRTGVHKEPRERHHSESTFSWIDACTQEESAAVFDAVNDVVTAAVSAQPATARLRVLYVLGATSREEVGQAIAPPMLDRDHCDIVIAARTREALDELRVRYPSAAKLPGHVVDLDSVGLQGAEALGCRFDLIILSEGLAGAPDPQRRLANIRQLLFSGSLFIMLEQHASRAEDLLYGLNATWWRIESRDHSTSVHSRRRALHSWVPALRHAGFEDVEAVCDTPESTTGPYLLIARASAAIEDETVVHPEPVARRTWLIVRDEAGYSAELAATLATRLSEQDQHVVTITTAAGYSSNGLNQFALDPASREHWRRLVADLQHAGAKPDAWVHLAGLDLATGASSTPARVAAQETRAGILMAWLQACSIDLLRPDCWVIAAQAGLALLPTQLRAGKYTEGGLPADRLRDAALWGFTRVAMQEFADLRLRWIDLADPLPVDDNGTRLAQEMLHPDAEDEIIVAAEGRFVPRMTAERLFPSAIEARAAGAAAARAPVQLDFSTPGPFRNLTWRREPDLKLTEGDSLQDGEIEIDVRAAGLNFRDVMYAMGLLPDEAIEDGFCGPALGMELSGVVLRAGPGVEFASGDEVIAIAPASFANRARTKAFAVTRKPPAWSFAAAATVPTAFFTSFYALIELARLQKGERVLIHGAAGGVGIAAIQIAKHLGAEVLATAGTPEKRDFVRLLGADHVFDSRSLGFADEILLATGGTGVDVVLNSLAGESMRRNLRLLRPFGRMIELGKRDFYENSRLGLRPFRNNISYFGIDADQLIAHRPDTARRVFQELMRLFADGVLRPLPHRSFCAADVEVAFRHMQASLHIGKIVITFPREFDSGESRPTNFAPVELRPDATYLVTGGLSGFGLSTARWLVSRGARHLALMSRTGAATPQARDALEQFADAGVTVTPIACDVADGAALKTAMSDLDGSMPPLRGVVHAAMVIEDALIRDMSIGQLHRVLAPKIAGALNLHDLTRDRDLDFFLLYSSATTLFGNPGQAAYVAANMAVEALAQERRALGLPAACISWGPIADSGYLARNETVRDALVGRLGGRALSAEEALRSLDAVLAAPAPQLAFLELDWNVLRRFLPASQAPKFSELARHDGTSTTGHETSQDLRRRLTELPESELLPTVTDIVRAEIAQILRVAPERIESGASLFDMGMDSLMAVELAASIEGRLGIQLSALALSDAPTIERIAARIVQQLHPNRDEPQAGTAGDVALGDQVRLMVVQHASEMTHEEATALSAEIQSNITPISLTAGHGS